MKRIWKTPILNTGTGLLERTIQTIESLTRASLEDGLTFEESVQLAIKTTRQTPHNTLSMTPFQRHLGRKQRTDITSLIGQPSCLLPNWKKTLTKYILAKATELQALTINHSDGELADYLVLNDTRQRARSVGQDVKEYKLYKQDTKLMP